MKKIFLFISLIIPFTSYGDKFQEKFYNNPVRDISVIASNDGYYPNSISAFVGEKVRFFVTATSKTSQCFVLQKHDIFIAAEVGKVGEGHTVLDREGKFKFYCPSTKFVGYLNVIKKHSKKPKRTIASERPNYWLPRDKD